MKSTHVVANLSYTKGPSVDVSLFKHVSVCSFPDQHVLTDQPQLKTRLVLSQDNRQPILVRVVFFLHLFMGLLLHVVF